MARRLTSTRRKRNVSREMGDNEWRQVEEEDGRNGARRRRHNERRIRDSIPRLPEDTGIARVYRLSDGAAADPHTPQVKCLL
ncbi:hypothetical protein E2C01_098890 [Portunus trituberculatus]|uniref:Uncharacterized protein n=1 Tax=Portunus trituberculatus TaxID=210409 RepID=A0A5B7JYV7_PORTR|nr:hypothetical protein [Portunus trituberculatus]